MVKTTKRFKNEFLVSKSEATRKMENNHGSEDSIFGESNKKARLRCGYCSKFHTSKCPFESADALKQNAFFIEAEHQICDEFAIEKAEDLIQYFSDRLLEAFTLKHFCKDGRSIGLFKWVEGAYVECGEDLKSFIEALASDMGLQNRIKTRIVNEAVEKTKRRTYFELKEEPLRIAFNNVVLDWKAFLAGDRENMFLPLEITKEQPCFHRIPHRLNLEFFDRVNVDYSFENVALEDAKEVVEVFRAWVGDRWRLLFEIIGYTLYPSHGLHKLFMLVGDGRNGKSKFLELCAKILGMENVIAIPLQDLCSKRFSQSELYLKLANIFPDIPKNPIAYTGWIKALTGEDLITADRKFKEPITFKNYAKMLFSANELPEVTDMTDAFWRRWILIEFPNKFEDDPEFFEKTFSEEVIEKIIVLSLRAFAEAWIKRQFSIEGAASDFKEQWLRRSNDIYAYVKTGIEEGRLVLEEGSRTASGDLYNDYVEFCDANDLEPKSKKTFTLELERLFKIQKKQIRIGDSRIYAYEGISLTNRFNEVKNL